MTFAEKLFKSNLRTVAVFLVFFFLPQIAIAMDAEAAKNVARKNSCLACHGIDKDKIGPAFNKVAARYKGKTDAEEKLINHFISGEPAKFPDGHAEPHFIMKNVDRASMKNLAEWILSL